MEADTQQKQRERQLFATLIASKPAPARSPLAFALSVAVHVLALGLLIFASHKYVPRLAHRFFEDVASTPEEAPVAMVPVQPQAQAAAPRQKRKRTTAKAPAAAVAPAQEAPPLIFTPGPIQPITPAPSGPPTAEPPENGVGRPGWLADQLRPSHVDPRVAPGSSYVLPGTATPVDIVRNRLADALRVYNDSIAAEDAAHRRALDWTIKTKDGKQWGIGADGKLHLGDITIPIPLAFSPPPGRRDEINARLNTWAAIEAQANREIGRQTFNDRVKAIRARKDKEREEKKKAEPAPVTN